MKVIGTKYDHAWAINSVIIPVLSANDFTGAFTA
jgi:hypothetical protein